MFYMLSDIFIFKFVCRMPRLQWCLIKTLWCTSFINVISYLSSFVFAFHLIKISKAFIHTLFFFSVKKTTWFLLSSSNTLGWYLARKNDTCINNHRLLNDFCTVLYVYTCNADIINFKCLEILSQYGVFFGMFVCLGRFQRYS